METESIAGTTRTSEMPIAWLMFGMRARRHSYSMRIQWAHAQATISS